jgi:hypothetical protein
LTNAAAPNPSAWGTGPWGVGYAPQKGLSPVISGVPFGAPATVSIANVFAAGATRIRVTLNGVPLAQNPVGDGDALNPNTWSVVRNDTGQSLTVIGVAPLSNQEFDLALLFPVGDYSVEHTLTENGLLSAQNVPCLPPYTFEFLGVAASRLTGLEATPQFLPAQTQDLLNSVYDSPSNQAGTLSIGPNGDYVNESGAALDVKMIQRRWSSQPNAFWYLPGFGCGLTPKAVLRISDVPALQAKLQNSALQEPDIVSCDVAVQLDSANGVIWVTGSAVRTNGQAITVQAPVGAATQFQPG